MNQATILGYVGRDAELRATPGGSSVANFSVATTERWGKGEDAQEKTTWHRIVVWGPLAEIAGKYVRKGSQVLVQGRIENRKFTDSSGHERDISEIVLSGFNSVLRLVGGKDGDKNGGGRSNREEPRQLTRASKPAAEPKADFDDDDVPF